MIRLGEKFENIDDLKKAIAKYEEEKFVQVWISHSRTIESAKKRGLRKVIKPELRYAEITYSCINSGKYKSHSKGLRPNQSTYRQGCECKIALKASNDGQFLKVFICNEEHNHDLNKKTPRQRASDEATTKKQVLQRPSRLLSSGTGLTIVSEKDGVRKITLNNPKKRNALSLAMLESLKSNAFHDVNSTNLRCILLQSSGPVFSSGHDLKELLSSDTEKRGEIFRKCSELMIGLRNLPVPVIAVVNGLAAAAGCQLVASCDIAVATSTSEFSTPGASVGLFCSTPGVAVSRNVPLKTASYMLFTGKNINAQKAVQSGLISKVVDESEMEAAVEDILQSILSKSRSVLALGKKCFYEQLSCDLEKAYEIGSKVMVDNLAHHDASEGIKAFFEKRPPKWVEGE